MCADFKTPAAYRGQTIHVENPETSSLGIVKADVLSGFVGTAITQGEHTITGGSFTPGANLFLSGATTSETAPITGFIQLLGNAITSTKINIEIDESIRL